MRCGNSARLGPRRPPRALSWRRSSDTRRECHPTTARFAPRRAQQVQPDDIANMNGRSRMTSGISTERTWSGGRPSCRLIGIANANEQREAAQQRQDHFQARHGLADSFRPTAASSPRGLYACRRAQLPLDVAAVVLRARDLSGDTGCLVPAEGHARFRDKARRRSRPPPALAPDRNGFREGGLGGLARMGGRRDRTRSDKRGNAGPGGAGRAAPVPLDPARSRLPAWYRRFAALRDDPRGGKDSVPPP